MDVRRDHTLGPPHYFFENNQVGTRFFFEDNQSQYGNDRRGQMLKTRAARRSASAHIPDVRLQYAEHSTLTQIFRIRFRVPRCGE